MARVTIRIMHVAWRGGRPRFAPGPRLRGLGFKGEDLRAPDGRWLSAEEARAWIEARLPEIEAHRAARVAGQKPPARPKRPGVVTVAELFDKLWQSPDMTGGRRGRPALAARTVRDYRQKAGSLIAFDPELAAADIRTLTKPILIGLHEKLWDAKGHHMANAILTVLRLALSYAETKGWIGANPAMRLRLKTPQARVRVGTIAEMTALIAAADALGETMIGHAIMLGLMTGQRQGDRLALQDAGQHEPGWHLFRQSKTGAVVEIPETPQLAARLAAAKRERDGLGVKVVNVVIDPRTQRAFDEHAYRHRFAAIRAAAVAGIRDAAREGEGAWLVPPCPTLATFRDGDLRDTAVTWLARAGCTVPMIRAITGHDEATVYQILKHYLAVDRELAGAAIGKLATYLEAKGAAL